MRSDTTLILSPYRKFDEGLAQSAPQCLIETSPAQAPVEALHPETQPNDQPKRSASACKSKIVPVNTNALRPFQRRYLGQLGSIVADLHGQLAAQIDDHVQFADNPRAVIAHQLRVRFETSPDLPSDAVFCASGAHEHRVRSAPVLENHTI
jgi:hypothetical protein